jgi:hypothetical protein
MVNHWGLGVLFPKNDDGSFLMHLQWYDSSSTVGRHFKVVAFVVVVAFSFFHICCRIYWDISNKNGRLILEMSQIKKITEEDIHNIPKQGKVCEQVSNKGNDERQ